MIGRLVLFALIFALALAAHAADHPGASDPHPVEVEQPFVRLMPPGQPNTAAFMVLRNTGGVDLALIGAESGASRVVELHDHQMVDGMMRMREVGQIPLPAGTRTALEPGGLHVMLIGLHEPLRAGQRVPITLVFDDAPSVELHVPVRHPGEETPMHHHGHRH
ncbi:MAG: copper chaperone PCu(A)C [Thioalkalivibrio sp.]|nr:MAG: copper chaperone PCu(A)C [Thioalkalivibrio sp.]